MVFKKILGKNKKQKEEEAAQKAAEEMATKQPEDGKDFPEPPAFDDDNFDDMFKPGLFNIGNEVKESLQTTERAIQTSKQLVNDYKESLKVLDQQLTLIKNKKNDIILAKDGLLTVFHQLDWMEQTVNSKINFAKSKLQKLDNIPKDIKKS